MTLKKYLLLTIPMFILLALFLFADEMFSPTLVMVSCFAIFIAFLCIIGGVFRGVVQTLARWWKTA